MAEDLEIYKDQWGGKIANGEEMWWSSVWPELTSGSKLGRMRFSFDPRHNVLLRFFETALAGSPANPKIVDFGCGSGGGTLNFSIFLNRPIEGFDIFPTQLEVAKRQNEKSHARCTFSVLKEDGTFPLADGSVDILFSSDVLGHVPNIPATLKDWGRVVRKGGYVVLFTEATYSEKDPSVMATMNRHGIDMIGSVPEHISLWTREQLEEAYRAVGFEVEERYSGSVLHYLLSPKEYLTAMKDNPSKNVPGWIPVGAKVLHFLNKITPFYPKPQQLVRNVAIRLWGREAYGCNYFYLLRKR